MSILIQFSPSANLVHIESEVYYKWALHEHYVDIDSCVSVRWCALGEYCTCLKMCTSWASDLDYWDRDKSGRHFADDIFKNILLNENV